MSETSQSSLSPDIDIVRDILLWRRKKLSTIVLLIATATWVVLEFYQYNFITVASWVAMFIVTSTFLWGNFHRLFNNEVPDLSGLEISEQSAMEMAHSLRTRCEEGLRCMFRVGAESDWFVFVGTLGGLWLLSKLGNLTDLLTLLYIGIVVGMTVPQIYVKYEDKIKECAERMRLKLKRCYNMIDDKVFRKIKNKVVGVMKKKKEKKIE